MRKPGLVELDAAVAVASHKSFRAVADELGASRSALSPHQGAARLFLMPFVFELMRRYPEVRFEMATDDRMVDILCYPGHRHVPAALRAFVAVVRELRARDT